MLHAAASIAASCPVSLIHFCAQQLSTGFSHHQAAGFSPWKIPLSCSASGGTAAAAAATPPSAGGGPAGCGCCLETSSRVTLRAAGSVRAATHTAATSARATRPDSVSPWPAHRGGRWLQVRPVAGGQVRLRQQPTGGWRRQMRPRLCLRWRVAVGQWAAAVQSSGWQTSGHGLAGSADFQARAGQGNRRLIAWNELPPDSPRDNQCIIEPTRTCFQQCLACGVISQPARPHNCVGHTTLAKQLLPCGRRCSSDNLRNITNNTNIMLSTLARHSCSLSPCSTLPAAY